MTCNDLESNDTWPMHGIMISELRQFTRMDTSGTFGERRESSLYIKNNTLQVPNTVFKL